MESLSFNSSSLDTMECPSIFECPQASLLTKITMCAVPVLLGNLYTSTRAYSLMSIKQRIIVLTALTGIAVATTAILSIVFNQDLKIPLPLKSPGRRRICYDVHSEWGSLCLPGKQVEVCPGTLSLSMRALGSVILGVLITPNVFDQFVRTFLPSALRQGQDQLDGRSSTPPIPRAPENVEGGISIQESDYKEGDLERLINKDVLREISKEERALELKSALSEAIMLASSQCGNLGVEALEINGKQEIKRSALERMTLYIHEFTHERVKRLKKIKTLCDNCQKIPLAIDEIYCIREAVTRLEEKLAEFPTLDEGEIRLNIGFSELEDLSTRVEEELLALQEDLSPPDHNLLPPELDLAL